MTDEKLFELISFYENKVRDVLGQTPDVLQKAPPEQLEALEHLLEMFPQMRTFVVEARREKLMRWLGWVQGVLYMCGIYTLEEMKRHNMPGRFYFENN
jgi:hypothetical protein